MADVIIIGAGVVGCAVARRLAGYKLNTVVLEKAEDVSCGASKANSGIVHAGFDAVPGTVKAYYNVKGANMYPALTKELGVPYRQNGSMVLAFTEEDLPMLKTLYERGVKNGVKGLKLLSREETLQLEKNVNGDVQGAMLAETAGIVSPYEMTIAMAYHAAQNGVRFIFDAPVSGVSRMEDGRYLVNTAKGIFSAACVINCAGVYSADIHNMLSESKLHITPRRGEYYLLDHTVKCPFEHTMFQVPGKMGKGVLVTPTAHGNTLLGPSADNVEDPDNTATTAQGLAFVLDKCRLTWKEANVRSNITTFAGIRAHEDGDDFVIGQIGENPGAFEAAGIESPGLTAAPAIGEELGDMAAVYMKAEKKEMLPAVPLLRHFSDMTDEERAAACAANADWGRIVCRCEQVTEAEILDALHRPVPARSVDGVKRRTRAGMGRCQGGFCSPRVMELISRETGIPFGKITKCGGNSVMTVGTLQEFAKEAAEK